MSWSSTQVAAIVRPATSEDDKYSRGTLAVVSGSREFPGAAVLGVEAAMRTGVGMVRYLGDVPELVLARRPEAVCQPGRADAWVIGSGMSELSPTDQRLPHATSSTAAIVCDAAALDVIVLDRLAGHRLLMTPHAGEAARLLGRERSEVVSDPESSARALADRWDATVLLKGSVSTLVSPGNAAVRLGPSSPWLASAGTGDVLAGILGALLASRPTADLTAIAASGVWIHDRAAQRIGGPLLAMDLASEVGAVIREVLA